MKPAHLCFTLVCLAQIFAITVSWKAEAWGPEGDRIVALVADQLLQAHDPAVQKKVTAILGTDKDNSWTKTDIAGEATWADVMMDKSPEGRAATAQWHYVITEAEGKDPTTAANQIVAGLTPGDISKWSNGTLEDWARESYDIAKSVAYSYPADLVAGRHALPLRRGEKDSCGAISVYRIDSAYQDRAIAAVRGQLAKAGVRLAFLLRQNVQ